MCSCSSIYHLVIFCLRSCNLFLFSSHMAVWLLIKRQVESVERLRYYEEIIKRPETEAIDILVFVYYLLHVLSIQYKCQLELTLLPIHSRGCMCVSIELCFCYLGMMNTHIARLNSSVSLVTFFGWYKKRRYCRKKSDQFDNG